MKKMLLVAALTIAAIFNADAAEKKRVIVVTATYGFRHGSIPYAEATLKKLGVESGVYEVFAIVGNDGVKLPQKPREPRGDANEAAKAKYAADLKTYEAESAKETAKWTPEKLEAAKGMALLDPKALVENKIDLVIFANTTGDIPLPDRDGFIKWIEDGHAFAAMHSGSDTFHGFPGYIDMLQGEFAGHGDQAPADLIAADTKHPANGGIGEKWDLTQEEMYNIKNQDPAKVRALWYMNHNPNNKGNMKPVYFPVSWVREAGKGRVFYTSLGHREDLWSDDPNLRDRKNSVELSKKYQAHLLGGLKWVLGLAEGSASPNPEVAKSVK